MELLICLLATFLACFFIALSMAIKKNRRKQTFIINDRETFLTKKDILELSKRNFLTHSWHRKRPGKNKGK